jgi:hypothetical protein
MNRKFSRRMTATIVFAAAAVGLASAGASAQTLAPHRAVYDVALKDASDRSGITGMNGRIVYEFQGSSVTAIRRISAS